MHSTHGSGCQTGSDTDTPAASKMRVTLDPLASITQIPFFPMKASKLATSNPAVHAGDDFILTFLSLHLVELIVEQRCYPGVS
jgi:hypothetical protein